MATAPVLSSRKNLRYAVVGLGHIAQAAVLPAFAHARNSHLAALVSGDPVKRQELATKYEVAQTYSYEEFDRCLSSGEVDAVYIALPNSMHREYTVQAALAGMHVLCEKPMGLSTDECQEMIAAAQARGVKLMIAYRLHFEAANLKAIEAVEAGKIGEPRLFASIFSMQVRPDNIRLKQELGGGTVYDLGIYCINAARYLFRSEPLEVTAYASRGNEPRFAEVDEMTTAILRFPGDRLATFTSSFGASDVSAFRIVGTEGELRVDPAYEFEGKLSHHLTIGGKTQRKTFPKHDQFAAELTYFSRCVLSGMDPEPSGEEGLADLRVIEAIFESAAAGRSVTLSEFQKRRRPSVEQQLDYPPARKAELVHVENPAL